MFNRPSTYRQVCTLEPREIEIVKQILASNKDFSPIQMVVDPQEDAEYYSSRPLNIKDGRVWVVLEIEHGSNCQPAFFAELAEAFSQETDKEFEGIS